MGVEDGMQKLSLEDVITMDDLKKEERRHSVESVYHPTLKESLEEATRLNTFQFSSEGKSSEQRYSLFACRLWHKDGCRKLANPGTNDSRPTVSPWGDKHVVIPATQVLESPDDFLIPLKEDHVKDSGGNTNIEMVYIRCKDVRKYLDTPYRDLHEWQLSRNPILRLDNDRLTYPVIDDLWFIILTPYKVTIPGTAKWEVVRKTSMPPLRVREVKHAVAKKVLEGLPLLD